MERRRVRWLRVAGGVAFLAVAVVTALATAADVRLLVHGCESVFLVLCAIPTPPPPPDWTPVVALGAIGIVLLGPRPRRRREADRPD